MKINLVLIALCVSTFAISQNVGQMNYYEYNLQNKNVSQLYFYERTLEANVLKEKQIEKLEITSEYKKAEPYFTIYGFNKSGYILYSKTKFATSNFKYIQDTVLSEINVQSKKKNRKTVFEHDSNFKITSETAFINDKIKSKRTFELDNGKIVKQTFAFGVNLKKLTVLEKKYNEEGKLAQTTFYKNGKVKNQWDYSCKLEGSDLLASKSDDLSSYCQYKEESADGSYKKYTRTIEKGKPYLFIAEYDKDSTFIRQDKFINDSILVNSTEVNGNTTMTSSFKNGKFTHGYTTERNESNKITKQNFINGKAKKCTSSNVYIYGEDELIISHEYFQKDKLIRKSNYKYSLFE